MNVMSKLLKSKHALLAVILVLTLALTACGSNSGGGSQSGSSSQPSQQPAQQPAQQTAQNQQEPQKEEPKINFPEKSITMLVPAAAGGGTDITARTVAKIAESILGQSIVIVNEAGASGTVAATEVARAKPDGYTLFFTAAAPLVTQPHVAQTQYQLDDFRAVAGFSTEPVLMAVRSDAKWKSLEDLLQEKDSGKTIKHGQSGTGTFMHIAHTYFYKKAGIPAESVPFQGGNPAVTALLGGHVDTGAALPSELMPHVESGDLTLLAITTPERFSLIPDVPTFKEKGFDVTVDVGKYLMAPKDTPDEVIAVLEKAFLEAANSAEFGDFLKSTYQMPQILGADDAMAKLKHDSEMYKGILREIGLIQ